MLLMLPAEAVLGDNINDAAPCRDHHRGSFSLACFAGDAVIVTASLGALKKKNIQFSPALPERKLGAIRRLGFGVLNKVRHVPSQIQVMVICNPCCYVQWPERKLRAICRPGFGVPNRVCHVSSPKCFPTFKLYYSVPLCSIP